MTPGEADLSTGDAAIRAPATATAEGEPRVGVAINLCPVNFDLNVFWTLVVVLCAPLLAFALCWGTLFVPMLLGYDPGI